MQKVDDSVAGDTIKGDDDLVLRGQQVEILADECRHVLHDDGVCVHLGLVLPAQEGQVALPLRQTSLIDIPQNRHAVVFTRAQLQVGHLHLKHDKQ